MITNKKCYDLTFLKAVVISFNTMSWNLKVRNTLGLYDVGEYEVKACLSQDEIPDLKATSVYLSMKALLLLSPRGYLLSQHSRNCMHSCTTWSFIMIMCLAMFSIRDRKQRLA